VFRVAAVATPVGPARRGRPPGPSRASTVDRHFPTHHAPLVGGRCGGTCAAAGP
jgi:hypothetical protein